MSNIALFSYIAAGFSFFSLFSFLITPFLLIIRLFGIRYYIIRKDDEKTRSVAKFLQTKTMNSITMFQCGNFYPSGCFINWNCIGHYNYLDMYESVTVEIHIMTTQKYFQTLFENEKVSISFTDKKTSLQPSISAQTMTLLLRSGTYTCIYYSRLRVDVHDLVPKGLQGDIVDSICKSFSLKKRGCFFIHGVSGAGKSTIGFLVANRLNGTLCHTFNPTEPGDTLQSILRESDPSDERPTIILLEEINTMIHAIHSNNVHRHKNITTCIQNKCTYNTFMDDLILYKNVMFIMTSNESKESIDTLDSCYLRKGRIDGYYSMMEPLEMQEPCKLHNE